MIIALLDALMDILQMKILDFVFRNAIPLSMQTQLIENAKLVALHPQIFMHILQHLMSVYNTANILYLVKIRHGHALINARLQPGE